MKASEYNGGDVMEIIHLNLGIDARNCYDISLDGDDSSGELILTMPDGSLWVVTATQIEDDES